MGDWATVIAAVITAIVSGVIGFAASAALQRREKRGQLDLKLLELEFEKIHKFLETEGLVELVGFFKDHTPTEVLDRLSKLATLDEHFREQEERLDRIKSHLGRLSKSDKDFQEDFQEQKERLDSMSRLLTSSLFNPVTGRIHNHIESNTLFISRLRENEESKEYLRRHITDLEIVQDILWSEDSIFVESGSTLACCMLPMIDRIQELRPDCERKPLRVCTNNISIYMILLFEKHFEPILLPGKPDNQYGATFADITGSGRDDGKAVRDFLRENEVTALFTTASFLDVEYGPHVSSERNHAMKRILNSYANDNKCTNILVIAAEKVNDDVAKGVIKPDCKLIFDRECTPNVAHNEGALERTRKEWGKHLRLANNYIAAGSYKKDLGWAARDLFCRANDFIQPFSVEFGDGCIVKLMRGAE